MAFAIHSPYNNGITTNMNDMFSSLNNIFVTSTPRQAESSDARMNLRHHDPEYQRRRKNKKEQETEDPFDGNDTAIVSIEALNTFLDNFIKANGADLGVKKTVTGRDFEKSFKDGAGAPPSRKREQAAQAAGAYQHSAQSNVKGNLLHTTDSADNNAPIPTFQMNQQELRAAQKLQGDIKELRRRQIEYVTMVKEENFLASLQSAISRSLLESDA